MKTIEIIVGPAGETRLETKGFTGAACKDASRLLEQALGAVQTERLTAEFHEQAIHDPLKTGQG
jgi:hypothetical protein